jgi:hypothetical protein
MDVNLRGPRELGGARPALAAMRDIAMPDRLVDLLELFEHSCPAYGLCASAYTRLRSRGFPRDPVSGVTLSSIASAVRPDHRAGPYLAASLSAPPGDRRRRAVSAERSSRAPSAAAPQRWSGYAARVVVGSVRVCSGRGVAHGGGSDRRSRSRSA